MCCELITPGETIGHTRIHYFNRILSRFCENGKIYFNSYYHIRCYITRSNDNALVCEHNLRLAKSIED